MQLFFVSVSIFLLMTFVATGESSECYACISTRENACMRPRKDNNASVLTRSHCGMAPSVTKLLRDVVPDMEDVFTVWPPTGNADCLRLNITLSEGETILVRTCTNLGAITCPRLQSALNSSSNVLKLQDCSTCAGDLCNAASSLLALNTTTLLFATFILKLIAYK